MVDNDEDNGMMSQIFGGCRGEGRESRDREVNNGLDRE